LPPVSYSLPIWIVFLSKQTEIWTSFFIIVYLRRYQHGHCEMVAMFGDSSSFWKTRVTYLLKTIRKIFFLMQLRLLECSAAHILQRMQIYLNILTFVTRIKEASVFKSRKSEKLHRCRKLYLYSRDIRLFHSFDCRHWGFGLCSSACSEELSDSILK
jgi:hypothetical protein